MAGRFSRDSGMLDRMGVRIAGVVAGFVVLVLVLLGVRALTGSSHSPAAAPRTSGSTVSASSTTPATSSTTTIPVPVLNAAQLAALPKATTFATLKGLTTSGTARSDGNVVRIARKQPGFATPGGKVVTLIPPTQLGLDTWLPIVDRRSGWLQVRLPSRPDGSLAWVPAAGMRTAQTNWRVVVSLTKGTLSITQGGSAKGTWSVGQGKADSPTPTGETFLLAGFVDPTQTFSPVIYALGTHSRTLDSFGGGPGTVAVHGWPTAGGRRGKISHGCIRVPTAALTMFAKLPTGTPVNITAS